MLSKELKYACFLCFKSEPGPLLGKLCADITNKENKHELCEFEVKFENLKASCLDKIEDLKAKMERVINIDNNKIHKKLLNSTYAEGRIELYQVYFFSSIFYSKYQFK